MFHVNPFHSRYNPFRFDINGDRPFDAFSAALRIWAALPALDGDDSYGVLLRAVQDGYDRRACEDQASVITDLGRAYAYGRSVRAAVDHFLTRPFPDLGIGFSSPPDENGWSRDLPRVYEHSISVLHEGSLGDGRRVSVMVSFGLSREDLRGELRWTVVETTTYFEESELDPGKLIERGQDVFHKIDDVAYQSKHAARAALYIHALVDYRQVIPAIDDYLDFVKDYVDGPDINEDLGDEESWGDPDWLL